MKVYRTDEIRNVVLLGHGEAERPVWQKRWLMYLEQQIVWDLLRTVIRSVILIKKNRNVNSHLAQV